MTPPTKPSLQFLLNAEPVETDAAPGRLLLDFLRRDLRRVGTKEGCREGDCGACTVLLGELEQDQRGARELRYRAVPACMLLLGHVRGRHVVTIEGLNPETRLGLQGALSPVQRAVVEHGASQCGFCTPGFVVSFTGFLLNATEFSAREAQRSISGNLCRCTGYVSLLRAGAALAERFGRLVAPGPARVAALVEAGALPELFLTAATRVAQLRDAPRATAGEALAIGGGTDLIVQRGAQLDDEAPHFLMPSAAERAPALEGDALRIPAAATFADLGRSDVFSALWPGAGEFLERFASPLIRERATLAGNLVNASPIADGSALLLALEAELELELHGTTRRLPLGELYLGYKRLALEPGERILAVRVPGERILAVRVPGAGSTRRRVHFEKVSKRTYLDIATVNSALSLSESDGTIEAVTISAGGVAPIPLVLHETAAFLRGRPLETSSVVAAAAVLDGEISPISDVRGSSDYKRLLLRRLFFAHFLALFPGRIEQGALLEVAR